LYQQQKSNSKLCRQTHAGMKQDGNRTVKKAIFVLDFVFICSNLSNEISHKYIDQCKIDEFKSEKEKSNFNQVWSNHQYITRLNFLLYMSKLNFAIGEIKIIFLNWTLFQLLLSVHKSACIWNFKFVPTAIATLTPPINGFQFEQLQLHAQLPALALGLHVYMRRYYK
jgi:hypothetical protein